MRQRVWGFAAVAVLALMAAAAPAFGQEVSFKDPTGDDNGPGTYTYPTDAVYKPGSFDLTAFKLKERGEKTDVEVSVNSTLEDPWRMGTGFSVQMVVIFIRTDQANAQRFSEGLPGLHIQFAPDSTWDKCIILSPQGASRVRSEVETKAASMKSAIIVPGRVRGSNRTISATIDTKDLGPGDPTKWGYQVIMQSNEGFPSANYLLFRKCNEYEGQHRFGGGNDGECNPNVMDILAGNGQGAADEADLQHKMLQYECNPDGSAKKLATLNMVYVKK